VRVKNGRQIPAGARPDPAGTIAMEPIEEEEEEVAVIHHIGGGVRPGFQRTAWGLFGPDADAGGPAVTEPVRRP
jgi:hypothetical protein